MNHLMHPPAIEGRTFKVKICTYHLSHSYGYWSLRKAIDGKPHTKTELTNKSEEAIFSYIAMAERCTAMEARAAYENTQTTA